MDKMMVMMLAAFMAVHPLCADQFEEMYQAAEQGDAWAQNNIGICYYNGESVETDKVEAVKWFYLSAEQGNAQAQYNLAYCYENGEGVEENKAAAVAWLWKAAEQSRGMPWRRTTSAIAITMALVSPQTRRKR